MKQQAAQLGVARSTYFPSLSSSASAGRASKLTTYSNLQQFDSTLDANTSDINANLSWVLYDFGLKAATLESARQLLNSAIANQDETFQSTFLNAAETYYDALASQATFNAAKSAEGTALRAFQATEALYLGGVHSLADKLQAQTALAQAKSRRIQAFGNFQNSLGTLATLMGFPPYQKLTLPAIADDSDGDESAMFSDAVDHLIDEAVHTHPRILAARAELKAARADIVATKAQGRPSISLTTSFDYSNTPIAEASTAENVRTGSIGLQLSIPLFEGFGYHYKIKVAEAKADIKAAQLSDTERQVALGVWKSYQNLHTAITNLKALDSLLQNAKESANIALGRYKSGTGTILELLKAQSDLADADEQKRVAHLLLQKAKLELSNSLGTLGK